MMAIKRRIVYDSNDTPTFRCVIILDQVVHCYVLLNTVAGSVKSLEFGQHATLSLQSLSLV
jgi:hypothetical protein